MTVMTTTKLTTNITALIVYAHAGSRLNTIRQYMTRIMRMKGGEMNMNNALANVEIEGFEFTKEQMEFLTGLVKSIDDGEITWAEAVEIVKARRETNANN